MKGLMIQTADSELWLTINEGGDMLEVTEKYEEAVEHAKNWNENDSGFFTETIQPGLLRFGIRGE